MTTAGSPARRTVPGRYRTWVNGLDLSCHRAMVRYFLSFFQLRFKLAMIYTFVTIFAVITGELVSTGVLGWFSANTYVIQQNYARVSGDYADQLKGLMEDRTVSKGTLTRYVNNMPAALKYDLVMLPPLGWLHRSDIVIAVTDPYGRVLASAPGVQYMAGRTLTSQLRPEDTLPLRSVLEMPIGPDKEYNNEVKADAAYRARFGDTFQEPQPIPPGDARRTSDGRMITAAPITSSTGRRLGILVIRSVRPYTTMEYLRILTPIILIGTPLLLLPVGLTGLMFAGVAARPLRRRLAVLSATTGAWGRGDFSAIVDDPSHDEIGDLGRNLNAMTGELRRHINAQQKLAALQERTRLARDLHDTVKQQAFAAAMQLGAARTVLADDKGPASVFVAQAEKLTNKVQEDLMVIIRELGPESDHVLNQPLPALLREDVLDWSQMSGIPADLRTDGEVHVSAAAKNALLKIVQEATANIARHSEAKHVKIDLRQKSDGTAHLIIVDDGVGFDPVFTPRGMGLSSMRDRALSLPGGRFAVETSPGAGVTIRVSCDCEAQTDA